MNGNITIDMNHYDALLDDRWMLGRIAKWIKDNDLLPDWEASGMRLDEFTIHLLEGRKHDRE